MEETKSSRDGFRAFSGYAGRESDESGIEMKATRVPSSVRPELQLSHVGTDEPSLVARQVESNPTDDVAMEVHRVATGVIHNGVGLQLDDRLNQPFDPDNLDQYLAGDPTLYFSTKSGGQGIKRSVDLTKKSDDKDATDRIPDDDRIKKQKRLFAEWKHEMRFDSTIMVEHVGLKDGSLTLKREDGTLIGKYNMKDLGLVEPNGIISGGGGVRQMFRDVHGIELTKEQLEAKAKKHEEFMGKMAANVKTETGGKLRGHYMIESRGNVNGHLPFHTHMSPGGRQLTRGEGWLPSPELFEAFGFMDRVKRTGRSDQFTLNAKGKKPYNDIFKLQQLHAILKNNLEVKLSEKQEEKKKLHPADPADAAALKAVTEEIEALMKAKDELLKQTLPISVTFPILLLNKTIEIEVFKMDEEGNFIKENNRPKIVTREFKGIDLLKPIPENKYHEFGVLPGDHQGAAKKRNDLLELVAKEGEVILGKMIDGGNTHRYLSSFWKLTTDSNPADAQVKTDMGGVVMQAGSMPSSDPTLNRIIGYAENHDKGNQVAQESRVADLLVHTVLRERTQDTSYALRGYNHGPAAVSQAVNSSLGHYQAVRARSDRDRDIIGEFTASDLRGDIAQKLRQRTLESLHPSRAS